MRIPQRKSEQDRRALQSNDPVFLTKEGIEKLRRTIANIERDLPSAVEELHRTREMGDLSENAAYHEAKGRVRGMQSKLFHLNERLKVAIEIKKTSNDVVQLGSAVTVDVNGEERSYELVGPLETDPSRGRISSSSPIGTRLIGRAKGDQVTIDIGGNDVTYTIINIE